MKFLIAAAIASSVALVSATCPNLCSGHGNCGDADRCTCYANWQGADCSERVCAYGLAWVDAPQVTLGVNFINSAHWYAECSNRGTCDRSTGLCNCFAGFEGKGCKRQSCPNSCSGHGQCYFIEELSAFTLGQGGVTAGPNGVRHIVNYATDATQGFGKKATSTQAAPYYYAWDTEKTQGCVCDAGYEGADCSLRQCPRGDNVLTSGATNQVQRLAFTYTTGIVSNEYTLVFTGLDGSEYTTEAIQIGTNVWNTNAYVLDPATTATNAQLALQSLPNHVITSVTVAHVANGVSGCDPASFCLDVTFDGDGLAGAQNLLKANSEGCKRAGCSPYYEGFRGADTAASTITVSQLTASTKEASVCSEHGVCDGSTGLCKCFHGYYDLNCGAQTVLV